MTLLDPRFAHVVRFMEASIPFNRFLGLKVDRLVEGACTLRLPYQPHLIGDPSRPALHGGVISMLLDTAGGAACFTALPSDQDRLSTVDLRVDYLRPGPAADLVATADVLRAGNRVAVARMAVFSEIPEGEPFALGHGVYNIHRAEP